MKVSVRSYLPAGLAIVGVSAIALASSVEAPPQVRDVTAPPIHLTAAQVTIPGVADIVGVMQRSAPNQPLRDALPVTNAATPAPTNAASDFVNSVYGFGRYWVSYGVQLADYALGFVPGLAFIGDQISIVYFNLGLPIADSVVYGLIDPVLNDPLNPASYINGLINVGGTTVGALVNTGLAEFNYFFGWLIPPLPPLPLPPLPGLPPLPFAAQQATTLSADLTTAQSGPEAVTPTAAVDAVTERLGLHSPLAKDVASIVETAQGLVTKTAQAVTDLATAKVSIPDAVTNAAEDVTGAIQEKVPAGVATVPDLNPTNAPVLKAVVGATRKAADGVVAAQGEIRDGLKVAVKDVANAAKGGGDRKMVREAVTAVPTAVAKGVRDGVGKAVDGVEKAARDVTKVAKPASKPEQK